MGTTTKGYPYPDPDVPLAEIDLAVKALAEKIDAQLSRGISAGTVGVDLVAEEFKAVTVSLPPGRFSSPPSITLTVEGNSLYFATLSGHSAASFDAIVRRRDSTSSTISLVLHWQAIQS
jgi:hypothetical protein